MLQRGGKRSSRFVRSGQIARVLSKYGLDWLADTGSAWRFLGWPAKLFRRTDESSQPEKVRLALEELGATYIKLGQAISTRTDLVPPEYVAELAKLQDDAPPISYEEVAKVVEEELGQPPEVVFAHLERTPMAAASIGQVHRATLSDGSQVVVKVQRPGVRERVESDLNVMRDFAHFLSHNTKFGRSYDFEGWFEEFEFTIRQELDYLREGRNADMFRENFKDEPALVVPKVFWDYTTDQVLTMERAEGTKISDLAALDEQNLDRHALAETCARIVLTEIFVHGFFHADPHPGNFFVLPDGRIALIDTGMVGRLDDTSRQSLTRIVLAMGQKDAEALVDELLTLGTPRGPIRRQDLKKDIERLIQLHIDVPPEQLSMAQMLNDTLAMAAAHNIRVQSDLITLARTIAMSEGLGELLDPCFRLIDFSRDFLEKHYIKTRSPQALLERTKEGYPDFAEVLINLPRRVRRLVGQLERGEISFTARLEESRELFSSIGTAANRLSMSVLIAGMIVGISVLLLAFNPSSVGIGRTMLQIFMGLAVAGGLLLFWAIWRSGGERPR